tara:strand:+ start:10554 stop:12419 length:1866 start_codon:yes stop_codon:yes gene_type:complete
VLFRFFESRVDPLPPLPDDAGLQTPPSSLRGFILYFSRPLLPWLALMAAMTATVSVIEVAFMSFLGTLVDWLGAARPETLWQTHGMGLLAMGGLIVIAYPLAILMQSLVTHQTVFGNYPMIGRWRMHHMLLNQSLAFFQEEFAGRLSQKVMQTALAIRESVVKVLDVFVYVTVYFMGAVVLVGQAEPWLIAPLVIWLVGYIGLLRIFVPRLRRISMAQADARADMTGRIVDAYTHIQTLKLFAHTRDEQLHTREAMVGFLDTVYRQMRLVTQLTVSLQTLNALLLASVGGMSVVAWQQGAISLGAIAVAIALVLRIRGMSDWILWEVASLFENIGTVQDGINTLSQPVALKDLANAPALRVTHGAIDFDAVDFRYEEGGKAIFEQLSVHIAPGERVGLVGRSGAGKSTLVNLLLRFYDVQAGAIRIDGQNIAHVRQESLRQQVGVVTQDTSLLHRSVRDNIRYGRPGADDAAIWSAARRAQADTFIPELMDGEGRTGLDAHVGERGVKLSGGQRQRIAIARMLLKNAPILILDEATSALDSEVEAAIQAHLATLMEGKTVIAIAHRLSTIAAMDRLIILDEGRIVETGRHDELIARNGLYAALWARQSGGFIGHTADTVEG